MICVNSNSEKVVSQSEKIYSGLNEIKFSVLFDDRKDISAGFKFKDADLLGMPLQIIVGEKNLSNDLIELKERSNGKRWTVNKDLIIEEVKSFFLNRNENPFCVGSEKYFSAIFGCSINKFEHNREK